MSENLRYVAWKPGMEPAAVSAAIKAEAATVRLSGPADAVLIFIHPQDALMVSRLASHVGILCFEPFVPRNEAWLASRSDFRARWYKAFEGPT